MVERAGLVAAALLLTGCATMGGAFEVVDIDGQVHTPLLVEDAFAHVLVFTTVDCPIANGYAPTIQRLADAYGRARFFLIHVDPDVGADRARAHAADYGYDLPVVLDPRHELVELLGVEVTPEVAVFSSQELVYQGRIDDWYAALGKKRRQATTSELADALEAVRQGREVEVSRAPAVGCLVPDRSP